MSTAAIAGPSAHSSSTNPSLSRSICRSAPKIRPFPATSLLPQSRHHHASLRQTTASSRILLRWRTRVFVSGEGVESSLRSEGPDELSLDALLSAAEVLCVVPPAVCSIGYLVASVLPGGSKLFQVQLGSRVFVLHFFLLVGAVAIGGLIRRRQWHRICRSNSKGSSVDLIGRIEKVEEDLRSSATIVRVLSRQLEKLGIRFRVTRKALKDPISEAAALAQKNSEATQALAMQEDILERELGEIQKVLLAMQEQQQKQLELILAVAKAGRLLEHKRDVVTEKVPAVKVPVVSNSPVPEKEEAKPLDIQTRKHAEANNE